MSLARQLSKADLAQLGDEEIAYFTLPLGLAVTWHSRIHVWFAFGSMVLGLGFASVSFRVLGWLRGLLMTWLLGLVAGGLAFAGWKLMQLTVEELPVPYDGVHRLLLAALLAGVLGGVGFVRLWVRGPSAGERGRELAIGGFLVWSALFGFFFTIDLEHLGASYPLAIATTCGGLSLVVGMTSKPGTARCVGALLLVPTILVLGPFLSFLVQLASQDLSSAAVMAAIQIGLGLPLLLPILVGTKLSSSQ